MSRKLRIAYFVHSLRSDWNNGNAHFLRGLVREMSFRGHDMVAFEPRCGWSIKNLLEEPCGEAALGQFTQMYPELRIQEYEANTLSQRNLWLKALKDFDIVVMHEWNSPELADALLEVRDKVKYRLLFHDTHHRAASAPNEIEMLRVDRFDAVVVFGEILRRIYREAFGISRAWTLHEAADTRVFHPVEDPTKEQDVVWVGNWGDEERSQEIHEFLLCSAEKMADRQFKTYGVRYPKEALSALRTAGVAYGGYLPNLEVPRVYGVSRLTVHIPRQQYARKMLGIPTIRVFEALACGIPLISAPWQDMENLFREGDLLFVDSGEAMGCAIQRLLERPREAAAQAERGRETVLARHTCAHRAAQLEAICEEVLR